MNRKNHNYIIYNNTIKILLIINKIISTFSFSSYLYKTVSPAPLIII